MPYPYSKDSINMLDERKVAALDDVLFKLFPMVEGDFFCGF
jgi:hypothetical protein